MVNRLGWLVVVALGVGCTNQMGEDLDPAASLAGEEWWDEGPPAEEAEAAPDTDGDPSTGTVSSELTSSAFELPFPCGQVWAGQTRTAHSPVNAIDFNRTNDIGDAVVAAAAGTVSRVDNEGSVSYGRWIEIAHGDGYTTRYAHLSVQSVRVGQRVARGQRIGAVGDTGGSSGPHLHYELRRHGVAIRPVFHGRTAFFFGTRNYTSQNGCTSGGGTSGGGAGGTVVFGRVNTAGPALTIRAAATTDSRAVGSVADGATVRITCQKWGQTVRGTYGTSSLWDFVGTGYVADAYVSTGSDGRVAPLCR